MLLLRPCHLAVAAARLLRTKGSDVASVVAALVLGREQRCHVVMMAWLGKSLNGATGHNPSNRLLAHKGLHVTEILAGPSL